MIKKPIIIFIGIGLIILAILIAIIVNTSNNPATKTLDSATSASDQDSGKINSTTQSENMATTSAQLKIEDLKLGEGKEVKTGDNITIHYKGTLENGQKFDSSYDRGQPFQTKIGVGQVIKGWDQGVVGMKVGGKRRLIIPPDLGYGPMGYPPVIPPNATLIFEVELVDIN